MEKKARKPMTEEQLERLALAREKANAMRKVNQAKRLQTKMNNLSVNPDGTPKESKQPEEQLPEKEVKEEEQLPEKELKEKVPEEVPEEEPEKEVIIKKKAKKKKQMVIVEQSSSDSDEFQSNDRVVFVKRVTKKKSVKLPEPVVPQQSQQMEQPKPPPPPLPKKTRQDVMYDSMFNGSFLNNHLGRRF
jgi:hypothetical protein